MKGGRHIRYDEPTPLANLHLTLLDKVGVRLDKFADSNGKVVEAAVRLGDSCCWRLSSRRGAGARKDYAQRPVEPPTSRQSTDDRCTGRRIRTTSRPPSSWSRGRDVKAANRYGVTPLSLACTNGNARDGRAAAEGGRRPERRRCPAARPPLMTAARTGKLDAVKALLARGADVNAKEAEARADGDSLGGGGRHTSESSRR